MWPLILNGVRRRSPTNKCNGLIIVGDVGCARLNTPVLNMSPGVFNTLSTLMCQAWGTLLNSPQSINIFDSRTNNSEEAIFPAVLTASLEPHRRA